MQELMDHAFFQGNKRLAVLLATYVAPALSRCASMALRLSQGLWSC